MSDEASGHFDPETYPCPVCGNDEFTWGHIVWNAPLRFKPQGLGRFKRGPEVRARQCNQCGKLELFVEDIIS